MTASVLADPAADVDRLAMRIDGPDGSRYRWADDEPTAERVPLDLTIASSLPGGDSDCSCQLLRDMRFRLGDLRKLNELTVYGPGNDRRWRGYLVKSPDTAYSVSPAAIGDVGRLRDEPSIRMIAVDRDFAHWGPMSNARRIALGTAYAGNEGPSVSDDSGGRAIELAFTGAWTTASGALAEALYRSPVDLGPLYFTVEAGPGTSLSPTPWRAQIGFGSDDPSPFADVTALSATSPQSGVATPGTDSRRFAALQMLYNVAGGVEGLRYVHYWRALAQFGRDVEPTDALDGGPIPGVLGPDVLRALLDQADTAVGYTDDSIAPDPFVIPHLVWLDPVTAEQGILDTNRFYRNPWAVYDRTFLWRPPETFGDRYTVRRDEGAEISSNGPDGEADFNGVIVGYTDVFTGDAEVVGPPAAGLVGPTGLSTATLADDDPELELNQWGRRRYARLEAGLTSEAGAIRLGEIFLAEAKKINVAGSITIASRQARDTSRARVPAWAPRAGDRLLIEDEADARERLIVEARYSHDSRTATLSLDAPDNAMEAILARLQVVLVGVVE